MPNVQFTISPAPGITNDLISVIYNTLAPAAEIQRIVKTPPHASPHDFSFTNLPVGTYIVKIHESPDGVTLGNLRHDFWVNAAITNTTVYDKKTFQVGLGRTAPYYDPAPGDTQYVNPDLDGLDYLVFKPGYGILDWVADIQTIPGGGFEFTNGQDFFDGELYTILVNNLVQSVSGSGPTVTFPAGRVFMSGDLLFDATMYSKFIEVGANNSCTLTMPVVASIPDNTTFSINTHGVGPAQPFRFVKLVTPTGGFIVNGVSRPSITIGRGESWFFAKDSNYWFVLSGSDSYSRVGQIVYSFGKPPLNSLQLVGDWYLYSDFERLNSEHISQLPASDVIISATQGFVPTQEQRTKWILGPTMFWLPDHGGLYHRMQDYWGNIDPARTPGDYVSDSVGPANVKTIAYTGSGLGKNSLNNDGVGFLATHGDGGTVTTDSQSGTNRNTARTGSWPIISPEGETRPKTAVINAYIIT